MEDSTTDDEGEERDEFDSIEHQKNNCHANVIGEEQSDKTTVAVTSQESFGWDP